MNSRRNTYRDEIVKRVYVEYQKRLIASNAVDFDDLLLYTARLLEDHPEVREKYAQRFRHVLVDEFQDTNLAQYALVKQLASVHHNIFCVGDPDQSIYRWRGADWRNVQRFEQDFPDAQMILLEQNYRSRQTILDAAMGVINRAPNRRHKKLFQPIAGSGEKIFFYEAPDDYAEASFVVDTIAQLVAARQFEPGECAVMYRTNAMSRLLEEAFLQARLPYRLVGAQRFYGRREVKDMIAFLRLVHNPADEASLDRVINVPPRGIGDKTLTTAASSRAPEQHQPGCRPARPGTRAELSRSGNPSAGRAVAAPGGFRRPAGQLACCRRHLHEWPSCSTASSGTSTTRPTLTTSRRRVWTAGRTCRNCTGLQRNTPLRSLDEFLENVALVADQDTINERNAPTLLTLHAAKGLEFGVVFIVGLDDGILPHSRSFDEPEEMEEERRLLYVGITRAKDNSTCSGPSGAAAAGCRGDLPLALPG